MELWIRSQDKETLVKAEHLDVYNASVEDEELFVIEDCGTDLGSYNTKERALEVLDEIQEAQLGNFHYRCSSNVKVSSKEDTIVYEMPEK